MRLLVMAQLGKSASLFQELKSFNEFSCSNTKRFRDFMNFDPFNKDFLRLHHLISFDDFFILSPQEQRDLCSFIQFSDSFLLCIILQILIANFPFDFEGFKVPGHDYPSCRNVSLASLFDYSFSFIHFSLLHHLHFLPLCFFRLDQLFLLYLHRLASCGEIQSTPF